MTIEQDMRHALAKMCETYCPSDGSPLNIQAMNEAYQGALTALAAYDKPDNWATPGQIEAARAHYQTDDVEIDDHQVKTSEGEGGTWIAAWVWMVDEEGSDEDEEDENTYPDDRAYADELAKQPAPSQEN